MHRRTHHFPDGIALLLIVVLLSGMPPTVAAQDTGYGKDACKHGGWAALAPQESPTTAFSNQGQCVSHAVNGGTIVAMLTPVVELTWFWTGISFMGHWTCGPVITVSGFPAGTYPVSIASTIGHTITVPADGATVSIELHSVVTHPGSTMTATVNGINATSTADCPAPT